MRIFELKYMRIFESIAELLTLALSMLLLSFYVFRIILLPESKYISPDSLFHFRNAVEQHPTIYAQEEDNIQQE